MKKIVLSAITAVALLAVCFGSMCLIAILPDGGIRANVAESCVGLLEEGIYPRPFGFKLFQRGNFADTIMLFESVTIDEARPLQSVMQSRLYRSGAEQETIIADLADYVSGDVDGMRVFEYSRYWHGYLVLLRPLLTAFTYQQIRVINYCVMGILLLLLSIAIWREIGKRSFAWFLLSQLIVTIAIVPACLQFFWTFLIAYAAALIAMGLQKRGGWRHPQLFFFVIGGLTGFFDLLVTPIITLGLPLICILSMRREEALGAKLRAVVLASLAWGIGYAFLWSAKWVIGGFITGNNIIADAISQADSRMLGQDWKGMELTLGNIFGYIFEALRAHGLAVPLGIACLLAIALFLVSVKGWKEVRDNAWLLVIAAMVPAWYLVLRQHTVQHFWFTYRSLMISAFAALAFIGNTCSASRAVGRFRK